MAVIAGAGSGKTRVLTRRIAYRIATGDADARHTLALTFTREAAGELRRRLIRLGLRDHVDAGTFHAVLLRILTRRWTDTGRRTKTIVNDQRRLLRGAVDEVGRGRSGAGVETAKREIDWALARGLTPQHYLAAARRAGRRPPGGLDSVTGVFEAYTAAKRNKGLMDFDDVLAEVLAEARRDTEFADVLRWRFRHVLVDEAQDLNPIQHRVIDLLRAGRNDLFVVGDPAQAVYGFNGADPDVLGEVEQHFSGIEVVRLPVNHRCTPQVVACGSHVLDAGGQPATIRSARDDGPAVRVEVGDDEVAEAAAVSRHIASLDVSLVRSGQIAVLARTNAQLAPFEQALRDAGVSVRRSATGTGSPLQVAVREAAMLTSPAALRAWAHDTLEDIDALDTASATVNDLERRRAVASRARSSDSNAKRAQPHHSQLTAARATLALIEAERRVAGALLEFLRDQPRSNGAEFRQWVATTNPFDDRSTDGVELLSFHASKGREWHTVFATGVETSLVPHKSATTVAEKAEEARLLYVACTRATDSLTITRAQRRGGYERKPSPFIADLDVSEAPTMAPPTRLRPIDPVGALRARLFEWRADAAQRARSVPDQLLSERDLSAIAAAMPTTAAEIDAATAIGMITATRLAADIVPLVVAEHDA